MNSIYSTDCLHTGRKLWYVWNNHFFSSSSSSSSGHEVRPTNDRFRPRDFVRLAVSFIAGQVSFWYVDSDRVILGTCLSSCCLYVIFCLHYANLLSIGSNVRSSKISWKNRVVKSEPKRCLFKPPFFRCQN